MEKKNNELEMLLKTLEKYVQEFAVLQQITNLNKEGKIKLSDEKFQKLEQKYIKLTKKMEEINKKVKKLKNEG